MLNSVEPAIGDARGATSSIAARPRASTGFNHCQASNNSSTGADIGNCQTATALVGAHQAHRSRPIAAIIMASSSSRTCA